MSKSKPWWIRPLAWLGVGHYLPAVWRFWVLDGDYSAIGPFATADDAVLAMREDRHRSAVLVEVRTIPVVWEEHIGTVPSSTWVPRLKRDDEPEPRAD